MGLIDRLRRKPMEQIEQERQRNYERQMARLGYDLASAKRQEDLAKRRAEIARLKSGAQKLTASSRLAMPDYTKRITDALSTDPFAPPKKRR